MLFIRSDTILSIKDQAGCKGKSAEELTTLVISLFFKEEGCRCFKECDDVDDVPELPDWMVSDE